MEMCRRFDFWSIKSSGELIYASMVIISRGKIMIVDLFSRGVEGKSLMILR